MHVEFTFEKKLALIAAMLCCLCQVALSADFFSDADGALSHFTFERESYKHACTSWDDE